jgi:predicted Zn-dependent protease
MSNLEWALGDKGRDALAAEAGEGILVTGFLGGNSNSTTGDFSLGAQGFRIRGGKIAEPVGEMNVSGNHLELWRRLASVGNDPYPYSARARRRWSSMACSSRGRSEAGRGRDMALPRASRRDPAQGRQLAPSEQTGSRPARRRVPTGAAAPSVDPRRHTG